MPIEFSEVNPHGSAQTSAQAAQGGLMHVTKGDSSMSTAWGDTFKRSDTR